MILLFLLAALLAVEMKARASDDLLIYSDYTNTLYGTLTFNNGWKNNGGMPSYQTNNPTHSGNLAICFNPNSGSQGLTIVHDDLDTSLYTNLCLWLNGGSSGGQTVTISGKLDGTEKTRIALDRLPANAWTNVVVSLAALGVANKTNLSGIRIGCYTGTVQPPFYADDITLMAAPKPAIVHIRVQAAQPVRTIDSRLFAINATAWDGKLDTSNTTMVLTDLNNQAMRWPGGSWGDGYHYSNEATSAELGWTNRNWGSFSPDFIQLATNTHAQAFIICNYGSGTPEEAAYAVRMFNVTNSCHFKYWEIGNENYGKWEIDNNTNAPWKPHDPWTYAMRFTNYYAQMKAVDPAIKIGAVVVDNESGSANYTDHYAINPRTGTTNYGWTPVMLSTLKALGVTPDFLIDHNYAPVLGDAPMLQYSKVWPSVASSLRQMLNDYMGSSSTNTELCVTECGPYGDAGRCSLVSALFYADSLGQILQTEINTRLWWDLRNGQSAINNQDPAIYGWRTNSAGQFYVDAGVVYGNQTSVASYPTYYAAKLMTHFAAGADLVTGASSDCLWLSAYAVQRTNGCLSLLVINKSSSSNLTAEIGIDGYSPASNALVYAYGIPQDTAARTGLGSPDLTTNTFNGVATNFNFTFPPYSATVLVMNPVLTGTNITYNVVGNLLTLHWPPAYTGWLLESNAMDLTNPNDWSAVPGSTATNQFLINLDRSAPKVFYRLKNP